MVPGVLRNGASYCSLSHYLPKPARDYVLCTDNSAERWEPYLPFFGLSHFLLPQSLLALAECPPGLARFPSCPQAPRPKAANSCSVSAPEAPPLCVSRHPRLCLHPISGVIRGSCLNWEKGPHPAFTLPVGGGGLAGWTLESWAADRVLGSPLSTSPLPG